MKDRLRQEWWEKRRRIPLERREEAEKTLLEKLAFLFSGTRPVLSYSSFKDELSTLRINQKLAEQKRLVLPRIMNQTLWLYRVEDPSSQLIPMSFGILEPDPKICPQIDPQTLGFAIVPAIAFDSQNHRLGYGKGYFDRFLDEHQKEFKTIGIGFKESFSETPFPTKPHDIALNQIILV